MAGLRGGDGKTLLSVGLASVFRERGFRVAPFKKGPDYIDAAWLSLAAGHPCRNLDLFLCSAEAVRASFGRAAATADVAVVEGNRGLFDGVDPQGSYSSAALAKVLGIPVLLVLDATKATRTLAAQVLGCQALDPEVPLRGVILNRTAGARHERVIRQAVEAASGLPVLGAVPRLDEDPFPERHLGLVPPQETGDPGHPVRRAGELAARFLDLEAILALARKESTAWAVEASLPPTPPRAAGPRIGFFRDAAFQFYYPDNLEALERAGGSLVAISALEAETLPEVDALYLGGGFPETLALELSRNTRFLAAVREAAGAGLPIYAECGGALYLGRSLRFQGRSFAMAGVLPVEFEFAPKPRGHGYTVVEVVGTNPFFPTGLLIKGHEFHYSWAVPGEGEDCAYALRVRKGVGFGGGWDGLVQGNVLACYTHVHALGTPEWAPALVEAARRFRENRTSKGHMAP